MHVQCLHRALLLLLGWHARAVRVDDSSLSLEQAVVPCGKLAEHGIEVGLVINGYTLGECLAGGFYAEAWKATNTEGETVVLKILKTERGQKDFEGHAIDESLLKDCLYGHAMTQRDPQHFVDCKDFGSFTTPGPQPRELMYSVIDFVAGRNLQGLLFDKTEAPAEIPKLKDVLAVVLELMAAFHSTLTGNMIFFHNDLQPSNLMLNEVNGVLKVKLLDYGEASICCAAPGPECTLGSEEVRLKLGLHYGESLDLCTKKPDRSDKNIAMVGLMSTARFLATDVLYLLCKHDSGFMEVPFVMFQRGDHKDQFVQKVLRYLRPAYADELNEEVKPLVEELLGSLYTDLKATYNAGKWPWQNFREKLEALQEKLA